MIKVPVPHAVLCLALPVFSACAQDRPGSLRLGDVTTISEDSAGIAIVTTEGSVLGVPLPWTVHPEPDFELDGSSGAGTPGFHEIAGVVGFNDGGLLVVDGGSQELRWFNSSGHHVRTTGGLGSGPGEFRRAHWVSRFPRDSILIFDRQRRGFSLVSADGRGVRTFEPAGRIFAGVPQASVSHRALFPSPARGFCPPNQGCEIPMLLRWVGLDGEGVDTLGVEPTRNLMYTEPGKPPLLMVSPFHIASVAAAGPDYLILGANPAFELRKFGPDGELTAIFRVNAASAFTPEEALDLYLASIPEGGSQREAFELLGLPEAVPAIQNLIVDRIGWIWAELYRPERADSPEWLVLNPSGHAQGVVETPADLAVTDIGTGYIFGVFVDTLGVERVRRHTLVRHDP